MLVAGSTTPAALIGIVAMLSNNNNNNNQAVQSTKIHTKCNARKNCRHRRRCWDVLLSLYTTVSGHWYSTKKKINK